MRKTIFALTALLLTAQQTIAADKIVENELQVIYALEADFSEIRENLDIAISGQGLVVNYVAHVGKMLQRTGRDIGANKTLYSEAEVFEFCSATLSREMMAADPNHIALCPYTIQLYSLPDQPQTVYLGYRRLPAVDDPRSRAVLNKIEALLEAIVTEAID